MRFREDFRIILKRSDTLETFAKGMIANGASGEFYVKGEPDEIVESLRMLKHLSARALEFAETQMIGSSNE